MTDHERQLGSPAAPGSDPGPIAQESAPPADEPFGLWATGKARYQQAGHSEALGLVRPNVPFSRPQGTWRSGGYRSSSVRAVIAIALVAVTSLVDLVSAYVDATGPGLIDQVVAGTIGDAAATSYDDLRSILSLVFLVCYIASAIAVLAWLSRVVDNTPPLTGSTPVRSPREAIGWWFVPIGWFFVPYQIVGDTTLRLDPAERGLGALRPAWWLCFLASSVLAYPVNMMSQSTTIEGIKSSLILGALSSLATVVSGVFLIVIARRVERFSKERAVAITQPPTAIPWGGAYGTSTSGGQPAATAGPTPIQEHVIITATAGGPDTPPPPPA